MTAGQACRDGQSPRLEVVITDDQVDHDWQMTDLAATMRPYAKLIRQLDAEMIEALEDTQ